MVRSIKEKILKSIKSKKLNVFGFFLLLSFMFLMVAKLSKPYTEVISFYVRYKNVPEKYSISPTYDSIIDVRVNAYGFNLVSHNFYKHYLTVDFKQEARKSDSSYYWYTANGMSRIKSQLGTTIDVLSVEPDSLLFPYEIMTVKTVPLKLDAEITYALGYDILDSLKLQPDSVKVIGPKNVIEKISNIRTTKISLNDVNTAINEEVTLLLNDSLKTIKLNKNSVKLIGKVEKFTEGTFEVPVTIVNLPPKMDINYFPKTISVSYYVSLNNYNKIKALDFKIVCDYNEVKDVDKSFFSPKLVSMPKEVKSAKLKQDKVEFIIMQ